MPDNPHKEIYGKDEAEIFVKEYLSKYNDFLQQLANYGSNLILRCYDIFYSGASETAHAATLMEMVSYEGDKIIFEQIRNVNHFDHIVKYGASLAIVTFRLILEKYRPSEAADNFRRKYTVEWRPILMNIPKVTVESGNTRII